MKSCNGFVLLVSLLLCRAEPQFKAGIALRSVGDVVMTGDFAPMAVVCSIQELEILADRCNYALHFVIGQLEGAPLTFRQQVLRSEVVNCDALKGETRSKLPPRHLLARERTFLLAYNLPLRNCLTLAAFNTQMSEVNSLELQVSRMNDKLSKLTRIFREDGLSHTEVKLLYGESLAKVITMNNLLEEELPTTDANKTFPVLRQPDLGQLGYATQELIHELQMNSWPTKDILLSEIDSFKNSFKNIRFYNQPPKVETRNASEVLNTTVLDLKYLKQNHSKDMINTGELLHSLYDAFEVDISLSSRLHFFDSVVRELDEKMWYLLDGLDSILSSGRLNPKILPPRNLTMAVRDAYHQLPKSFKPLFDLNYNYDGEIYPYYSFSVLTGVVLFKDSIRIFAELPMIAESRFFNLYEARSLPIHSDVTGDFLQIVPPSEFLVVNKMKDKAAWMRASTLLNECKHFEGRFVCPTIMPVETVENSCILNMLLMKVNAVSRLCKIQAISKHVTSTWIRDRNGWIYSVPRDTRLERIREDVRTPVVVTVSGTGFLTDQMHTYTKTEDGFILYPALHNLTSEVMVPNIDLTSLEGLQIVKANRPQEVVNESRTLRVSSSDHDSRQQKENLVGKDTTVYCDTTPLWVAIIINTLLVVALAGWVFSIRKSVPHSKAISYKSTSEENVKINSVDLVDNN